MSDLHHKAWDLTGLAVLIVDDSPHMRLILRAILRALGIRHMNEAADGGEALELMRSVSPDLVLADWEMAPMGGLDFVRALRAGGKARDPFVPVIMISGHTEQSRVVEARNAGVDDFLAKPLSAQVVYGRIARLILGPRRLVAAGGYRGPDRRGDDGAAAAMERRSVG